MPKADKLHRWLDLITALLARNYAAPFEELARDVPAYAARLASHGKSDPTLKRTFERDKKELKQFGIPIETVASHEGDEDSSYRLKRKDFYLPYLALVTERGPVAPKKVDREGYRALETLTFEPDELQVVAEAAARVRQLGNAALRADAESAMRKLAFDLPVDSAMPDDDTRIVPPRAQAAPEVFVVLADAVSTRKRVRIEYASMSSGTNASGYAHVTPSSRSELTRQAERIVEPFGLFYLGGHWYLAARDDHGETVKNYRMNRIAACRVANPGSDGGDFEIPRTFSLKEHARSRQAWELGESDVIDAVVEFRGTTGQVASALTLGAAEPGHEMRRRFQVRRMDVFARWVMSFAGDAVPIAPAELVTAYAEEVRQTLALYSRAAL